MTLNSDDPTGWQREYDQRQYRRMIERLEFFEAGDLDLGGLVADLGTLLTALQQRPEDKWADEISALREDLGIIDSVAAYRAETALGDKIAFSDEEMLRARDIVASLRRLVLPKVEPWSRL
jgi:hypothetical protein